MKNTKHAKLQQYEQTKSLCPPCGTPKKKDVVLLEMVTIYNLVKNSVIYHPRHEKLHDFGHLLYFCI